MPKNLNLDILDYRPGKARGRSVSPPLADVVDDTEWTATLRTVLPHRPYSQTLAERIMAVHEGSGWPSMPPIPLLEEVDESEERGAWEQAIVEGVAKWKDDGSDEQHIRTIAERLGERGILCLLGMRQTPGSVFRPPPDIPSLVRSFNDQHQKGGKHHPLTVGARALAKHSIRDKSTGWWGEARGGDAEKNAAALKVLLRVLEGGVWANSHCLPGGLEVFEVRTGEGYGARWTADGSSFRGFLEPPMVDGHEKGWHH